MDNYSIDGNFKMYREEKIMTIVKKSILLFLILTLCCCSVGCQQKGLELKNYYTPDYAELYMDVEYIYGYSCVHKDFLQAFTTDMTPYEICENINENNDFYTASLFDRYVFVESADKKEPYFVITQVETTSEKFDFKIVYCITSELVDSDEGLIYFPYHLTGIDIIERDNTFEIVTNAGFNKYKCVSGIDFFDFMTFYEQISDYDVSYNYYLNSEESFNGGTLKVARNNNPFLEIEYKESTGIAMFSNDVDHNYRVDEAEININLTDGEFSKTEINSAVECVKEYIADNFEGCTLQKVEYDTEFSADERAVYVRYGVGSQSGVPSGNVVVLTTSFCFDESAKGDWSSDETYDDYKWYLTREDELQNWKVEDFGY